jgi:hypothetical protein
MSHTFAFTHDELCAGRISHERMRQLMTARCTIVYRIEHQLETDADREQTIVVLRARLGAYRMFGEPVMSTNRGPLRVLQFWCLGDGLGGWRWCPARESAVAGRNSWCDDVLTEIKLLTS